MRKDSPARKSPEDCFQEYLEQLQHIGCLQKEEFVAACVPDRIQSSTLALIRENEAQAIQLSQCFSKNEEQPDWQEGGIVFGRFQLERRLGAGSSGVVWQAKDVVLSRVVALKVLREHLVDERATYRLALEARVLAGLDSPGVVRLFSTVTENGSHALVTECVGQGETLKTQLQNVAQAWLAQGVKEIVQLLLIPLRGLAMAHRHGILHRDIKQSNILWSGEAFKLCDFGLASVLDAPDQMTLTGEFLGTKVYASPEQTRGEKLAPSTDVFSFGLSLLEALIGSSQVHEGTLRSQVSCFCFSRVARNPALRRLPKDLQAILRKSLDERSDSRYPDAGEFAADLEAWCSGEQVAARIPVFPIRIAHWLRRNPVPSFIGAILFGATVIVAFAGFYAKKAEAQAIRTLHVTRGIIQSQNSWLSADVQGARRTRFLELDALLASDRFMPDSLKAGLWSVLGEGLMSIGAFHEADRAFLKAESLSDYSLTFVMHAWSKLEQSHAFPKEDSGRRNFLEEGEKILAPIASRDFGMNSEEDYATALAQNRLATLRIFLAEVRPGVSISEWDFLKLGEYLETRTDFPSWFGPMNQVDLGVYYLVSEQFEKALSTFDKALRSFREHNLSGHEEIIYAYIGRQQAFAELGDEEASCEALEDIVLALRYQGKGYTSLALTHQKEWVKSLDLIGESMQVQAVWDDLLLRVEDPRFEGTVGEARLLLGEL
ncbi:MAG: serine/threonine-protein kinase [Planctomycetota bacterium]